jgi:hypothetical protein
MGIRGKGAMQADAAQGEIEPTPNLNQSSSVLNHSWMCATIVTWRSLGVRMADVVRTSGKTGPWQSERHPVIAVSRDCRVYRLQSEFLELGTALRYTAKK